MAMTLNELESLRDEVLETIGSECSSGAYNAVSIAFDRAEAHLSAQAKVRVEDAKEAFFREYHGAYEEFDLPGIQALWRCWQSSWNAARLSQGAQGEAVAVVSGSDTVIGRESRSLHWLAKDPYAFAPGTKLYTHPAERAAVPDGMVLIRRDELEEVVGDAIKWLTSPASFDELGSHRDGIVKLYEELLTAAPKPPEGARVVDKEES